MSERRERTAKMIGMPENTLKRLQQNDFCPRAQVEELDHMKRPHVKKVW